MLKLIKCEFLKLKRKKFIPLIILAAFLFPLPLTYLMTTPSMMERYERARSNPNKEKGQKGSTKERLVMIL